MPTRERRQRQLARKRGELPPYDPSRRPDSLRSHVIAACHEMQDAGIYPTQPRLTERFPGVPWYTLAKSRSLARLTIAPAHSRPDPNSLRSRVIAACEEMRSRGVTPTREILTKMFPSSPWSSLASYRSTLLAEGGTTGAGLTGKTATERRQVEARARAIRDRNMAFVLKAEEAETKRLARLRRGPKPSPWSLLQAGRDAR